MVKRLIIFFTLKLMSWGCYGQCFSLNGNVRNASTSEAISAAFSIKTDNRKQVVGKSDDKGIFSIQLPCNSTALIIEKQGFRTVNIPLSGSEGVYYFDLDLYPVDKQITDRPYFQSEQKDIVLDNSETSRTGKSATRFFKLTDVQTKTTVAGNVCLYFTKTGDKKCFDTGEELKREKVIFDQEDIIGVVVNATGYQPYNGNLIIDQINNGSSVYEIALSKMTSLIAFSVKTENPQTKIQAEISDKKGRKVPLKMVNAFHGFALVNTENDYVLKVSYGDQKRLAEIVIPDVKGLSLVTLMLPKDAIISPVKERSALLSAKSENFNPLTERVIYFKQSSYDLNPEIRQTLDSIASWLSQNPRSFAQITGFTDNIGDPGKNVVLSEFRAKVTASYLVNRGVKEAQLHWKGLGGENPAGSNESEKTKALNRRVEIKISP